MKPVVVYTTSPCPYCSQAKALLRQRGIAFEEVQIPYEDEEGWKQASIRSGGMKTMPQIFIDGKILGGYTELAAADKSGALAKLLA